MLQSNQTFNVMGFIPVIGIKIGYSVIALSKSDQTTNISWGIAVVE